MTTAEKKQAVLSAYVKHGYQGPVYAQDALEAIGVLITDPEATILATQVVTDGHLIGIHEKSWATDKKTGTRQQVKSDFFSVFLIKPEGIDFHKDGGYLKVNLPPVDERRPMHRAAAGIVSFITRNWEAVVITVLGAFILAALGLS